MLPFMEAGPLRADLLQKGENVLSLPLASETVFGRYRLANFLPTYFIYTVTEQSLGKHLVVGGYGSAPRTTTDVCVCVKDERMISCSET